MGRRATSLLCIIAMLLCTGYRRSDWGRWQDLDGDCQDTRQEVLIRFSEVVPTLDEKGCKVIGGEWVDPYDGKIYTDPKVLDIDHIVPLQEASVSGGERWDRWRKEQYFNDERHLLPTHRSHNRSKGARGPGYWKPPDETVWCSYARVWVQIKSRWELTAGVVERMNLKAMLDMCKWERV